MPWGLKRFHESGQSHSVTFCCYHRRPLFPTAIAKRIFEAALERVRCRFGLHVYGYVIMPEHVRLLLSEPQRDTLADALKSLKQGVSRRLIGDDPDHFWQKRYYDFNVRNQQQFVEKVRYIHRNPVKRGLCEREREGSRLSRNGRRESASGRRDGCVQLSNCPTQASISGWIFQGKPQPKKLPCPSKNF
jgi:putative transposase